MGLVGGVEFQALHLIAFVLPATSDKANFKHLGNLCSLMEEEGSLLLLWVRGEIIITMF